MKFTILTLFPDMIEPFLNQSVLGRAQKDGLIEVELRNLRDWATDKHKTVDDTPYGGGPGMVIKVDVIDQALSELKSKSNNPKIILLTPQGKKFTQVMAQELADKKEDIILVAGHYEGFDERIRQLVDLEISIGDFVLTGGELPAAVIIDAVTRLVPGVLGNPASLESESHQFVRSSQFPTHDYPTYTRPDSYQPISREVGELSVPEVLKSGDHAKIDAWRQQNKRQV